MASGRSGISTQLDLSCRTAWGEEAGFGISADTNSVL